MFKSDVKGVCLGVEYRHPFFIFNNKDFCYCISLSTKRLISGQSHQNSIHPYSDSRDLKPIILLTNLPRQSQIYVVTESHLIPAPRTHDSRC